MKKIIIRVIVLILVFAGAVFVFSKLINRGTAETTRDMKTATLPIIYMKNDGVQLNGLHGYTQEMNLSSVRDTLTPLTMERVLDIQIQTYGVPIDGIYFEVLSLDGKESLENTSVTKYQEDGEYVNSSIKLQNLILMNQEYVLKIQLKSAGKDIYYYTRILQQDGLHTKSYLDFVLNFYDKCISKSDPQWLTSYTEPDDTGSTTSLNFMNIHCTAEQLSWGDLNPQIYYKPIPEIKELNESTASVVLEYMIAVKNEDGKQELYDVKEFYRMRNSDSKIMLLDFERTTQEVFEPNNQILTTKGLKLGITERSPVYVSDSKQKYFAFVQAQELYSYNSGSNKLTQVFSFRENKDNDLRDVYSRHSIHIIQVDGNGNIYFTVSGYMNRGEHEGENGVALYSYEEASGNVSEKAFVKTQEAYELLKTDLETLTYVSDDQEDFYFMAEAQVYEIKLSTLKLTKVVKNIAEGCAAGSESGKQLAWIKEGGLFDGKIISIMDMDTKVVREITCKTGEALKIIGFMGEDLIYGIADLSDVDTRHTGNEVFPMKKIEIVSSDGTTIKEYAQGSIFITETVIEEKVLSLTRVVKDADGYKEISEDHIVMKGEDEDSEYGPATQTSDRKQTEVILKIGGELTKLNNPPVTKTRQVIFEESRAVELKQQDIYQDFYYLYSKGKLNSIYSNANAAIKNADGLLGVVVDGNQQYVWERGNKQDETKLDLTKIPEAMKQGNMDVTSLQSSMKDVRVIDLSGCSLDMILYFVSNGRPVLVQTDEGVRLMVGYDPYNTLLLKPGEEEPYYYPSDDSKELFEKLGNIFITYMES